MRLTFIFLILSSIAVSQTAVNPYIIGRSIEAEIGLLPNSNSYVQTQETHKNNILVEKRISESFYNYGNIRYCFENDYNWYDMVHRMKTLYKVNDTISLQTELRFWDDELHLDSTLVFSNHGKINHVEFRVDGKLDRTIDLKYNANGMISKTYNSHAFGKTVVNYYYSNDLINKVITLGFKGDSVINDYQYTDSLITNNTYFSNDHYRKYKSTITKIDTNGNMILKNEYDKYIDKPSYELIKTTQWEYLDGGTVVTKSMDYGSNIVVISTVSPNEDTIIRTTWNNENKTTIQTFRGF